MRSARLVLLLVAALFVAAEPVIHTHPLLAGSGRAAAGSITSPNFCGVCAVGAHRILTVHVVTAPRLVVVERVAAVDVVAAFMQRTLPRCSRAPPSL